MGLGMLGFWGALILAGVAVYRAVAGGWIGPGRGNDEPPLEVLRRRFAAGEISREEFDEMRRVLEQR